MLLIASIAEQLYKFSLMFFSLFKHHSTGSSYFAPHNRKGEDLYFLIVIHLGIFIFCPYFVPCFLNRRAKSVALVNSEKGSPALSDKQGNILISQVLWVHKNGRVSSPRLALQNNSKKG
ncbi:hypothetical protein XENTR_v10016287 [Xenopus tropicalis]|nr:hypothetical protein XENTR_v10016287 [Xenopus tropicalis]